MTHLLKATCPNPLTTNKLWCARFILIIRACQRAICRVKRLLTNQWIWSQWKSQLLLIRLHLLSAHGEDSGVMICCIGYVSTQISSRSGEDNDGGGKRQKANKEPAFELSICTVPAHVYQALCGFLDRSTWHRYSERAKVRTHSFLFWCVRAAAFHFFIYTHGGNWTFVKKHIRGGVYLEWGDVFMSNSKNKTLSS